MSSMSSESSTEAALPKTWQAFVAKPGETTAKAVAKELGEETNPTVLGSLRLMAKTLAQRPVNERSTMSRLIAAQLTGDVAFAFMKATAAVRLAHLVGEAPKEQPVPQHDDPHGDDLVYTLDLLPPEKPKKLPEKTEKGRDWQTLDALDLAPGGTGPGKVTVDLVKLAQRVDDVRDASSMGHLREALKLVNTISGGRFAYSKDRRGEIGKKVPVKGTTQEHIVEQIGFRAAPSQRDAPAGLSAQNDLVASYWRTNFREKVTGFVKKLQVSLTFGPGDILVNSPRVLHRLQMVLPPKVWADLSVKPLVGTSGISVLSGAGKHSGVGWDKLLYELGATPSAYQLYELMDREKTSPEPDFTVDTHADLVQLITSGRFSLLQEIARATREIAPVCAMVEHLVLGLTDKLGPDRYDALTANALRSLSQLIDIVVANEINPTVAMRAADLVMDEIAIVVAVAKYYHGTDYRNTMRAILRKRAPSIAAKFDDEIEVESQLMTSGMDAIATALYIALSSRGHEEVTRSTEMIDYYETGELLDRLKKGERATPRKDVLVAALNPSTPAFAPSPAALVEDVLRSVRTHKRGDTPFALILDTTIEIAPETGGRTQIEIVLDGLKEAVAAGALEVFLCKSFQKYASFGTGKVAAGDLTMLSAKDNPKSVLARAEAMLQDIELDLAGHDEAQLVVHMLKHGHRDELALMRSSAGNAEFVDRFCWPIDKSDLRQGTPYVEGIPLILRTTPTGDADALFQRLALIDKRDSFSFLRTSYVGGIPSAGGVPGKYVRINTGHESKAAMVEYFYAFGHLATSTPPGATEPSTTRVRLDPLTIDSVHAHLKALDVAKESDSQITRYLNNIKASYCAFALQVVADKATVMPLLAYFFAESTDGVTIETQRYLAAELLTFTRNQGEVGSNPVVLTALYNAAVVLPAWRRTPLARGLWSALGTIGTSEEATRLRDFLDRARQ
ncbi:hypothetical protein F5972_24295 [Microbispora cellulosiformans]|uniref:Uncharacterized protein n=1 Tax=Microbispora cellulosiformans TaxID=2614688 RepID=A0A5J5K0W3_9ACTN|nr:hypothetical protein [Microbispora cellulosiformans]KAA9376527.1 hypothetical protein F5972_24295 [Microbispora cellulosiformans]